jgi:hypothetical protein
VSMLYDCILGIRCSGCAQHAESCLKVSSGKIMPSSRTAWVPSSSDGAVCGSTYTAAGSKAPSIIQSNHMKMNGCVSAGIGILSPTPSLSLPRYACHKNTYMRMSIISQNQNSPVRCSPQLHHATHLRVFLIPCSFAPWKEETPAQCWRWCETGSSAHSCNVCRQSA